MNILIVKLSAIGDVIHTLPALNAIRQHYPDAHITWLVEEAAADLVIGHQALDRVIVSGRKRWIAQLKSSSRKQAIAEIRAFWRDLRDTHYDIIIDFQSLLKSGMLVRLARGTRRIGFDKGMQHQEYSYLFLNERVPPVDMEVHALTRGLMLLEAIGIHTREAVYHVPVSENDRRRVNDLLRDQGIDGSRKLVAINPVALWETKLWRNERFAELAGRLIRDDRVDVVFTGGPDDRRVVADIQDMMTEPATSLAGKTSLTQLAELYRQSEVLITTDTGPMHLAAAVGTPVVALFGPTAPWRTGPFGEGHRVIRTAPPCSPCFKRRCDEHQCRCMNEITVEMVREAVNGLLAEITELPINQ
ncbi:lipopolysaccharide heptosyltransferase I [uncultured Desulfosarcina sp.]|uniref:lipopolysaccharide heptosyltransferase I n=1 Tax=uncultured Desulfosarcina sp. TaxID=218289 RepID=UPI0029C96CB7|nr:lipopolysaccharide heptosyltransferase I [uncultured Desulfosarcina sp.]